MADVFSKKKRSELMSRIRSHGNKATEVALAKLFRRHGITGWRRQVKIQVTSDRRRVARKARKPGPSLVTRHPPLSVRPDFVFARSRTAVFVDGCFWHGCPKHCKIPAGNRAFWKKKFDANKARDRHVNRELRRLGWLVVRIWEHDLAKRDVACVRKVQRGLVSSFSKSVRLDG
jgi:DNA mismatch endonuclease (patch repair protein)